MTTPVRSKFSVPPGGILIHKKWKDTKLSKDFKVVFNNVLYAEIDPYDFLLYGDKPVIYIPETNLVVNINLPDFSKVRPDTIIIAVRNTITAEQYAKLQDTLVISSDKKFIPLGDPSEMPDLLHHLSFTDATPKKISIPKYSPLNVLLNIPTLGKLKAERLLNAFGTIERISTSSISELSVLIDSSTATEVHKYFNS